MSRKYIRYNLSSWGKTEDTNILFILGISGSGKTTLSLKMVNKFKALLINLDSYFEQITNNHIGYDENLNNYLSKVSIPYKKISDRSLNIKERFKIVDQFQDALIEWSKLMYKKGIKVIVEGVQLLDETIFVDKYYFQGRPTVFIESDITKEIHRNGEVEKSNVEGLKRQKRFLENIIKLFNTYSPPWNFEQLKNELGDKLATKLMSDPVHKWRAETGIELIHKEPTLDELNRIWMNWNLMSNKYKKISDDKSIELFGMNNKVHYNKLFKEY